MQFSVPGGETTAFHLVKVHTHHYLLEARAREVKSTGSAFGPCTVGQVTTSLSLTLVTGTVGAVNAPAWPDYWELLAW